MDFKQIQRVLIIAFLLFDVYLVYMLLNRVQIPQTDQTQAVQYTIQEELSNRGVEFYEFSEEQPNAPYLMSFESNVLAENIIQLEGQQASVSPEGVLTSTFDEPIDLNIDLTEDTSGLSDEDKLMLSNNYLGDPAMFIEGNSYRNFWYVNTRRAIYIRMTDEQGNPIVNGTAEIQINLDENFDMVSYVQTYQENITPLEESQNLISELQAIENIDRRAETYIPDGSTIHYSVFVYYRSTSLENYSIYSPAWQFIYDNDTGRYTITVDAIHGNVVGRSQVN